MPCIWSVKHPYDYTHNWSYPKQEICLEEYRLTSSPLGGFVLSTKLSQLKWVSLVLSTRLHSMHLPKWNVGSFSSKWIRKQSCRLIVGIPTEHSAPIFTQLTNCALEARLPQDFHWDGKLPMNNGQHAPLAREGCLQHQVPYTVVKNILEQTEKGHPKTEQTEYYGTSPKKQSTLVGKLDHY